MTRKPKPATPAGAPGMSAAETSPFKPVGKTPVGKGAKTAPANPKPKPGRIPAHLPGAPGKGGFTRSVKPVPLPGKSRGR